MAEKESKQAEQANQDNIPSKKLITGSPQIHDHASTTKIMWSVSICLIPAAGWGVYVFGIRALWVILAAVITAVLTEYLIAKAFNQNTLFDGSAFLSGLLIGMNMPPGVPLYIPVVASVFAMAVVKWTFGGLGRNWMNPALAGRVFVFFSWTSHMTAWTMPRTLASADAVSGSTPLGMVKTGLMNARGMVTNPFNLLSNQGYPVSGTDAAVSQWLNTHVLNPVGISLPEGYADIFIGNVPGSIGEVSALLLLAGTVYLLARRIITWEIPAAYIGTFAIFVWIFGGRAYGTGFFSGDILFHLFTGGLMLGVFYMATDMATSPMTRKGMLIFGAGAGFLTFLIRIFGSFPEGVSLAIIIMNMFVPLINRYTRPARFGLPRKKIREAAE
ncbi:MAG: RnfABCDGE type electron transport complex subunit D [Spirochaetia bacterium]